MLNNLINLVSNRRPFTAPVNNLLGFPQDSNEEVENTGDPRQGLRKDLRLSPLKKYKESFTF